MSRTRRLTLSVAALTLLPTVTGCAFGSGGGTRLTVLANVTDKVAMASVLKVFRAEHPDITVTVTYADTNRLQKNLPRDLEAGEGPDVFTVWPGNGNPASAVVLSGQHFLTDLTLRRFAWNLPEDVASVAGERGRVDIVPASYSAIGAIYAAQTLDEIGGAVPTTYTQVLALCDKAREHGKVLFALGNETPWVTQLISYSLAAGTVYAGQPTFAADMEQRRTSFARSPWKDALGKYLEMNDRRCFGTDPLATTYQDSLDQVASRKAVGIVQVAATIAELKAAAPGLDLTLHALPASDDPQQTRMPAAVSAAYGVNAHTPHPRQAKTFADFLGSAKGQNLYNSRGTTLPAIPNSAFTTDPAVAEVARRQKNGTTVPFMDQTWPNSEVQQTHFRQINALFAGRTTVTDALKAMDRSYRDGQLD
ncbi:extracellular solute-binding protein [Streptomyces sp. NPDC016845]|uniref:ABC transporter substrate-binding protein n=1 Tax=Streptomyces sp. NPDC016845 TaxID=3364972 RepID=UPI0037A44F4B